MSPASLSGRILINNTGARFQSPASLQRCVQTAPQFALMLKRGEKMSPASLSGRILINNTGAGFQSPASLQRCVQTAEQFLTMFKL